MTNRVNSVERKLKLPAGRTTSRAQNERQTSVSKSLAASLIRKVPRARLKPLCGRRRPANMTYGFYFPRT